MALKQKYHTKMLEAYLEKSKGTFTVDDLVEYFKSHGIELDHDKILMLISPYLFYNEVIKLRDNEYFSNIPIYSCTISILPTKKEIEEGYLIIGHRLIPYINCQELDHNLNFTYKRTSIKKIRKRLSKAEIRDHYYLFGDDLISFVLDNENANLDEDTAYTYYDPECITVPVTVLDVADIYKKTHFKYGDRFLLRFNSYQDFKISVLQDRRENPFEPTKIEAMRKKWFAAIEKTLILQFQEFGPKGSINDQLRLALVFNPHLVDAEYSGSFEELVENSKILEVRQFGISTRLWEKNKEMIAIREWNEPFTNSRVMGAIAYTKTGLEKLIMLPIENSIIKAFILDSISHEEKDSSSILKMIIPEFMSYKQEDYDMTLKNFEKMRIPLKKIYNRFLDYKISEPRHELLKLLCRSISLLHEIRLSNIDVATLNQQALLVILYVIGHIKNFLIFHLSNLEDDDNIDMEDFFNSLEGMQLSFNENSATLLDEIHSKNNNLSIKRPVGDD